MNPNMENTNPHKMEADSRDTSYVPREHVPRQNNTGPQNERTNEIVVSGDTKHVLRNLAKELESRDDDRWHILAIPESNILGLEETSGEAVGQNTIGEASRDRVPLQRPGQVLVSLSTTDLALFQEYLARRLQARQPDSHTTNQSSEDQDPSLWFNTNPSSGPTPPSPRTQAAIMEALAEDGCLQNRSSGPDVGHMKELALDAHTLNNDSWSEAWRMEDKTGTGECGWCDRRGHEAIDCIRWDPIHFDKGVCVLCNNRLHGIDECVRFEELDLLEQANLILDMGRMKPGVRSVANSWTSLCKPDYYNGKGLPMTRDYIRRLETGQNGQELKNLWREWNYYHELPEQFHDKELDTVDSIQRAGKNEMYGEPVYKPGQPDE